MKKWICLLLALSLVLSLSACGKKQDTVSVDLQAACDKAIEEVDDSLVFFPASSEEINSVYPGLSDIECKQLVAYFPPVMGASYEVVMVEVANSKDVDAVKAIFQTRIDSIVNDTTYPDNAAGWKAGADIYVNGSYVVLSVLPEGVEKPAAFKAEF